MCFTAITLFAALAIPAQLAAQEQPAQTNPVPLINQPLVPDAAALGGKGFTLTVNGTSFVSSSVVNWNGSALATTFVSGAQLTATVPASDISKANTASVTVFNPSPGGGMSNIVFFPIALPTFIAMSRKDYNTGPSPPAVSTGDLNGDGKLDLVVTNGGDDTISVFLGNGDGRFFAPSTYVVGSGPRNIAIADFNGDGKLDLAVTYPSVSVLLGNGDGTFQNQVQYDAGAGAWGIAAADVNGDGNMDLVVTNTFTTTVSVLLGKGDGTFQPHKDFQAGPGPRYVAIGDFNGDGKLDLAVANFDSANTITVLLGNRDGTFSAPTPYPAGSLPTFVTAADFNGDGKLDLAVSNQGDNTISVFLGNGDGTFQPQVSYPAGPDPTSIHAADFNGDGILDLATANYGLTSGTTASIYLGNGDGTFQPHMDFTVGLGPDQLAVGDFNGDGRLDLAAADQSSSQVSILLQDGTIRLLPASLSFGVQVVGTRSSLLKEVLTNLGRKTLDISSIKITGTDAGDFRQHNNCGSSLPPKAHCTISVTFKPTKLRLRSAAVTVTDNAPGSPQHVPLSGIGVTSGPNATLSTKHLTFAIQLVGTRSPAQPVKLTNYGAETLDITSIVASGDFSKKDDCGSSVPPGGSCTIEVDFAPTRGGHRAGTLTITDNAPDSPQKVSLIGVGTVVKLDPTSLDFGAVQIGQKSSPQNTTLTNVGKTRLHITGITITGTNSGDFSIEQDTCPNPGYLGGGKFCTITVVFKPTQVGSRSADVSFSDDGGGSPQLVSLSGTGENHCTGRCGWACFANHCGCSNGRCVAASNAVVDETASQQTCKTNGNNPFEDLR
jgi:hypothetical protein